MGEKRGEGEVFGVMGVGRELRGELEVMAKEFWDL